jgi:hypothetical protein
MSHIDSAALGRAAADDPAYAVFRREVEGAGTRVISPACVAAIRRLGRNRVVTALVRKRLALKRFGGSPVRACARDEKRSGSTY